MSYYLLAEQKRKKKLKKFKKVKSLYETALRLLSEDFDDDELYNKSIEDFLQKAVKDDERKLPVLASRPEERSIVLASRSKDDDDRKLPVLASRSKDDDDQFAPIPKERSLVLASRSKDDDDRSASKTEEKQQESPPSQQEIKKTQQITDAIAENLNSEKLIIENFDQAIKGITKGITDPEQKKRIDQIIQSANLNAIKEKAKKIAEEKIGSDEKVKKIEALIIKELKAKYNRKRFFVGFALFAVIIGFFVLTYIFAKLSGKSLFGFIKSKYGIAFTILSLIILGFVLFFGYRVFFGQTKKDYDKLEELIKNSNVAKTLFEEVTKNVVAEIKTQALYGWY